MRNVVTQEIVEESNINIMNSIETARQTVYREYDRVDDEWYRSFLCNMGDVLYYLGRMIDVLNDLRYPVYPGKYAPLLNDLKRRLAEGPMDRNGIGVFLENRKVPDDEISNILDMLHRDTEIDDDIMTFRLADDASAVNIYKDADGSYIEDRVEEAAKRIAVGFGMEVDCVFCNNPYGDDVEVILKKDDDIRIGDLMELEKILSKEFRTAVTINTGHNMHIVSGEMEII